MTDEQKNSKVRNKRKKERYHNMNDEEKQKLKDYQRQYRKNMTDEQKQKSKDYQTEYQKKYRQAKKLNNKIETPA